MGRRVVKLGVAIVDVLVVSMVAGVTFVVLGPFVALVVVLVLVLGVVMRGNVVE